MRSSTSSASSTRKTGTNHLGVGGFGPPPSQEINMAFFQGFKPVREKKMGSINKESSKQMDELEKDEQKAQAPPKKKKK